MNLLISNSRNQVQSNRKAMIDKPLVCGILFFYENYKKC